MNAMNNLLYMSPTGDGWKNLAADEWFLDHLPEDTVLLYFYINDNAVIIGKNQNPWRECDLTAMEQDGVQLVRRVSGGGAVYHDGGNLNFSFIASRTRYDEQKQFELILQAVRSLGIACEFSGRNDLLAEGRKFSGNAFCHRGPNCQHHGTLLVDADMGRLQRYLKPDPRKLRAKGVASVRSRVCNLKELCPGLTAEAVRRAVGLDRPQKKSQDRPAARRSQTSPAQKKAPERRSGASVAAVVVWIIIVIQILRLLFNFF